MHEESVKSALDMTESNLTETSEPLPSCHESMFLRGDFLAPISLSRAKELDSPASPVAFFLSSYEFWRSLGLHGSYLRTSMLCYPSTAAETWESSSPRWLDAGIAVPGGFATVSIGVSHSGESASSLSDIQVTGRVPRRYFLSPRAAKGILRRAEKRGVTIQAEILSELSWLAGLADTGSAQMMRETAISLARALRAARKDSVARLTDNSSAIPSPAKAQMPARTEQGAALESSPTPCEDSNPERTATREPRRTLSSQLSERTGIASTVAEQAPSRFTFTRRSARVIRLAAEAMATRKRTGLSSERSLRIQASSEAAVTTATLRRSSSQAVLPHQADGEAELRMRDHRSFFRKRGKEGFLKITSATLYAPTEAGFPGKGINS
jgi:hypothetical protein